MSLGLIAISLSSQTGGTCNPEFDDDDFSGSSDGEPCAGILETWPAPGASDVAIDSVGVRWDARPTTGVITVSDEQGVLDGALASEDDGRTVVFWPDAGFAPSMSHVVWIAQDCADDVSFEFVTAGDEGE